MNSVPIFPIDSTAIVPQCAFIMS